jgi:hypothetical protein
MKRGHALGSCAGSRKPGGSDLRTHTQQENHSGRRNPRSECLEAERQRNHGGPWRQKTRAHNTGALAHEANQGDHAFPGTEAQPCSDLRRGNDDEDRPGQKLEVKDNGTDKSKSTWFWDPNQKTVMVILTSKLLNQSCRFYIQSQKSSTTLVLGLNQETHRRFWGQTGRKCCRQFWGQTTHKPSTLVLRLNHKTRAPSLHVPGADRTRYHLTSRPPDHRVPDLCDHSRSSAPGLLLLPRCSSLHAMLHLPPAHHKTNKHNSPNETKVKEKQNKNIPNSNSNLTKSMTHHNQTKKLTTWFLKRICYCQYMLLLVSNASWIPCPYQPWVTRKHINSAH